ncbi:unnamed protein product [Hermetia illucens]|uniref:J domain-containing protein n=1 Tax=Hermetia illucens TaxID=343691 RepID=A0A7R8UDY9_HERIL|nr:dnaJ homolog subfamily C member 7 [Hermetia illucens]CAD7078799.1 unnamed protein product [Hermetia illucens]
METSEVIVINENEPESPEMDVDILVQDNDTIAEEKKKLGNDQYKAQDYQSALKSYTDAITLSPKTASFYNNRAACHMMLLDYKSALSDARRAIELDNTFEKAYVRVAKCCLILGDIIGTEQAVQKVLELVPNSTAVKAEQQNCAQLRQLEEKIQSFYEKKVYRTAVFFLDNALKIAHACTRYKIMKAECLSFLGRIDEAADIAVNIMKVDTTCADAIYVRGLCLYYSDHLDKGIVHFEHALQLDPDHQKSKEWRVKSKALKDKKERGNTQFKAGKYREAHALYTEALNIDPFNKDINSKLYYNRALVNSKLGNLREAVADCSKVLEINDQYLKALLLRAKCYNDLEKYEECVKDYEAALKIQKTPDIKNSLRDAKFNLKKSKRKDYYKILGVSKNATDEEIKKAYRKKALVHHPDRHANSSDADKKAQELKFKEVGEAYAILSDSKKKLRYDNGHDLDDEVQEFDPNQMFRHFFQFSGDGANTFSFQF